MKLLTVVVTTGLAISTFSFATENVTNAKVFQPLKPTILITLDKLKAFPTAEGAGANATGGRGGRVIYVKNRNASGEGSLKAALEATGKRTIVFAIGGRFNNDSGIQVGNRYRRTGAYKHSDFTLAGQTANDKGGVHIANSKTNRCRSEVTFNIYRQENMILRYFDTRYNWQWWAVPPGTEDTNCRTQEQIPSLRVQEAKDLIFDHISSGWSSYGLPIIAAPGELPAVDRTKEGERTKGNGNVTVQRSLMHENAYNTQPGIDPRPKKGKYKYNHNVGMLLGNNPGGSSVKNWNNTTSFSIHKNAFIGVSHRMPNTAGGDKASFNVINNYSFGFRGDGNQRLSRIGGNSKNDFVNNVYQQTKTSVPFVANEPENKIRNNLLGFRFEAFLPRKVGKNEEMPVDKPNFYIKGNLFLDEQGEELEITQRIKRDPRLMLFNYGNLTRRTNNRGDNLNAEDHGLILREQPISAAKNPVSILPANLVKQDILSNVGGNVRFKNDGSTYIDDPVDKNYISWALNNAGPENNTHVLNDGGLGDTGGNNTEFGEFRFKYPEYSQAPAKDLDAYDSDKDGMPNTWEIAHKLGTKDPDPTVSANAVRADRDWEFKYGDTTYLVRNNAGYTNLEMYLADIAGDFHMLAKTEGKPINGNNNDEIKSIDILNPIIIPATTAEAFIGYSATEKRDVKCFLKNAATNKLIAFDKSVVNAGSGMTVCDLDIPANTPGGNNYLLYTYMTKANGKWSERVAEETKKQIQVMALTDDLVSINIPSTVNAGKSVSAYINYSAKADRQMKCSLRNKSTGNYVGFDSVSVSAGIGKVEEMDGQVTAQGSAAVCNFDLPANTPQGDYTLGIYMTKPNGKWSERFDLIMTSIKIEK